MVIIYTFIIICIFRLYLSSLFEGFNDGGRNHKTIILIGDSILDNEKYAEKSITYYIESNSNTTKEDNIVCLAEDNSTIYNTISSQLPSLTKEENNNNTCIFISVGGNDILQKIVYRDASQIQPTALDDIISDYNMLVSDLTKKMNKTHIILMTLYYPQASFYRRYDPYIKSWNIAVKACAKKHHCQVLDLSDFMTEPEDFSHDIEPSTIGGKKLSNHMVAMIA